MVRSGTLRHRLTLEKKSTTKDDAGQELNDWFPELTLAASITPVSALESAVAARMEADVTHLIKTRYSADVKPDKRFVLGTGERIFNIEKVWDVGERRRSLEIQAIERL